MKGRNGFLIHAERPIQEVFARYFVDSSVSLDLIPNHINLTIAADSTSIRTGLAPMESKAAIAAKKVHYDCDCKRRFANPQTYRDWDSHRKEYFYGYAPYELTAAESLHSLPIYLRFAQAHRHDSVLGVVALTKAKTHLPESDTRQVSWRFRSRYLRLLRIHHEGAVLPLQSGHQNHQDILAGELYRGGPHVSGGACIVASSSPCQSGTSGGEQRIRVSACGGGPSLSV